MTAPATLEAEDHTWEFSWPERGVTVILLVLLGAVTIGAASRMHVSTREDLWALCATLATLAYGVLSVGRSPTAPATSETGDDAGHPPETIGTD